MGEHLQRLGKEFRHRLESLRAFGHTGIRVSYDERSEDAFTAALWTHRVRKTEDWRAPGWDERLRALTAACILDGSRAPMAGLLDHQGNLDARGMMPATMLLRQHDAAWLPSALLEGELSAQMQPVFDLKSQSVIAYEAYLRTHHRGRLIGPTALLAAAEEFGLTLETDEVARGVCLAAAAELLTPGQSVIVNVSSDIFELAGSRLHAVMHQAESIGLDASRLILELGVDDRVALPARWIASLTELASVGVRISLSGIGNPEAALAMLREFRPEIIKLSRWVTPNSEQDLDAGLKALVVYAHSIGLLVGVQWIEHPHQLRWAQALGVDLAQGWLFNAEQQSLAA